MATVKELMNMEGRVGVVTGGVRCRPSGATLKPGTWPQRTTVRTTLAIAASSY